MKCEVGVVVVVVGFEQAKSIMEAVCYAELLGLFEAGKEKEDDEATLKSDTRNW